MFVSQFIYSFGILASLFYKIKSDGVIHEQRKTASKPELKNQLFKTLGDPTITTAINEDDEKFYDNEPRKVFGQNSKVHENFENRRNENDALGVSMGTNERNITLAPTLECLSCYSSALSSDEKCYKAIAPKVNCDWGEECYSEVHPMYIKRGCIIQGRTNRTFVCKCPLCNDKPSSDKSFYTYRNVEEWQLDNFLLQKPLLGIDIVCKICATQGVNGINDQKCRYGRNADYTICGHGQICYTNIDDKKFLVSRGCVTRPVYNSWFHFCKEPKCNNVKYNMNSKYLLSNPETALSKIMPSFRTRTSRSIGNRLRCGWLFVILTLTIVKKSKSKVIM